MGLKGAQDGEHSHSGTLTHARDPIWSWEEEDDGGMGVSIPYVPRGGFETRQRRQFVILSLCYSTTLSWRGGHREGGGGLALGSQRVPLSGEAQKMD